MDIDAITADLQADLDATQSKGANIPQRLTHVETQEDVSLLETPRSNAVTDVYDSVSVLGSTCTESPDPSGLLGYTAFAATCSTVKHPGTQTLTVSSHHLDRMAFAATVMDGTTLIASSQQLRSADGILLEPLSLSEAKMRDDWPKWQEAMASEMNSMNKMSVFKLTNVPADGRLISVRWVYKLKLDTQRCATRYKACLVAQGYAQRQGLDYDQTFSPVVHLQTVQILLAIARRYGLHAIQLDVSTAFLNGKIDKDVYVCIPPMFETKQTEGKCYRLKKALYGLKQAGRLWHAALDEQLQAFGFKRCRAEPCVYTRGSSNVMVLLAVYVDDLLVIGATASRVKLVQQQLLSTFSITDQGDVSHIIRLNVHYDREARMLSINQSGYIKGILTKFGMDEAWAASTLATETINTLGPREGDTASDEEVCHYTSLVRSLLWITQGSRPDITFTVGRCAHFVTNPSGEHLAAAKRILRYLKGTVEINLSAGTPAGRQMLTGWADSDWAGLRSCRRLTLGYVFIIDELVCSWSLQLQPTVANSSVEVEYVALAGATRELLWTSMFLRELQQPVAKTAGIHVSAGTSIIHSRNGELVFDRSVPVLYSDSSGARAIASDPQHFKRTKHIDIAHFFLRDEVTNRRLTIAPVQSSENVADILIKPLTAPTPMHIQELLGLSMTKEPTGSRGGVGDYDPVRG
ncbi:uncharacterized protein UHOD_11701 [Ustilago sp. UG-2017b]|nr:uncharacterized protein UHOD_11701 [Ustilago sp. UG-2017b]